MSSTLQIPCGRQQQPRGLRQGQRNPKCPGPGASSEVRPQHLVAPERDKPGGRDHHHRHEQGVQAAHQVVHCAEAQHGGVDTEVVEEPVRMVVAEVVQQPCDESARRDDRTEKGAQPTYPRGGCGSGLTISHETHRVANLLTPRSRAWSRRCRVWCRCLPVWGLRCRVWFPFRRASSHHQDPMPTGNWRPR